MSTAQVEATDGEQSAPVISTVAGTVGAGSKEDNEPAVKVELNGPYGIAVDHTGTLYFSEYSSHRVRKVTTDGKISTVVGNGVAGSRGDKGLAVSAQLNYPREVAVDSAGAVYIADGNNHRIRKITADGKIDTVAGDDRGMQR